jgi:AcrR family transcriptional regulator
MLEASPQGNKPAPGLRERKKARTRAAIQQHALRLFREQGYDATTVEQIAAAAEFSPSTFFRYFPTKEDVVLYDALDPLVIAAFEAQPAELSPVEALRRAMHAVFDALPPDELQGLQERLALMRQVPELRARMLEEFSRNIEMVAEPVAKRVGRRADDFAVRTFAGALMGVMLAVLFMAVDDPQADLLALIDAGMTQLEAGLPL